MQGIFKETSRMESDNSDQSSIVPKLVGGAVAILVCCACVIILAAGWVIYQAYQDLPGIPTGLPTEFFPPSDSPTHPPVPTIAHPTMDVPAPETMDILNQALVPENDPYELACRLRKICDVSRTVPGKVYQVGDKETFWVGNNETAERRQITATLHYITPHSYFWAEDGARVDEGDVKRLMDAFENKIYPTDREFFGSEFNPGIDNDPHIFVIYASGLGGSVAGYFNSSDSFNPLVKKFSNAHETYMLSTTQKLGVEYTYSTLAHEFVHMIQFASDRNEDTWMTEGFAELGHFLNGYKMDGKPWLYTTEPDLQLNDWNAEPGTNAPHYGQSFLFLAYFLDRFGGEATKALNANPGNGLSSIDDTLAEMNITDPQTGEVVTADDVFMDWSAALYLGDGNIGDGRFTYHNYPGALQASTVDEIGRCPGSLLDRSVNQYGIDYINVNCPGDHTLHFSGSTVSSLLPADAYSGEYVFWSNRGDESDTTLTREFDFTGVSGPITLSYQTWYNIEENWDYLYLEASTDGETWDILKTPSGTDYNPSGNAYGWGYTGSSNGWIKEEVDLSPFAGQKVQLRFEYVTDAAVNEEGLMLDDISIDAINYASDLEADDGGWQGAGFVRIQNILPQTYRLTLIVQGDTTSVTNIPLTPNQTADIPLSLQGGDEAILIVTGTTHFTTIPAPYQVEVK
jgi:hypothetical protein